jgi:hypothetical protein
MTQEECPIDSVKADIEYHKERLALAEKALEYLIMLYLR